MKKINSLCPECGGEKKEGRTTFVSDLGFGVIVIRDVPAKICVQCGADWISDSVAAQIEEIVTQARKSKNEVAVSSFAKAG